MIQKISGFKNQGVGKIHYDNDIVRYKLADHGFYYISNGEAFFHHCHIHPLEILQQHNRFVNVMLKNYENYLLGPTPTSDNQEYCSKNLDPAAHPWHPAVHETGHTYEKRAYNKV